ncbi:hypothetical protein [Zavarzinella formosa]|nr:hypothetical protein [Zavarzinella formosa]
MSGVFQGIGVFVILLTICVCLSHLIEDRELESHPEVYERIM